MTQQHTHPEGPPRTVGPAGPADNPVGVAATRTALIKRSDRSFTPIPKVFIQNPDRTAAPDRRGPLADFVHRGDKRGLLAFLLLHTIISSGDHEDGWSTTLHLQVWARALGTVSTATGASASSAATKTFTRLVDRRLIERRRKGRERKVTITLLSADGSGDAYRRPTGKTRDDRFIRLNHQFWTEAWDERLSLPAIAMLLVALHEKPDFSLPAEKMPAWYGWSADTAERGLRELVKHHLIAMRKEYVIEPLSPTGWSQRNVYTVLEPFDSISVERDIKAHRKACE